MTEQTTTNLEAIAERIRANIAREEQADENKRVAALEIGSDLNDVKSELERVRESFTRYVGERFGKSKNWAHNRIALHEVTTRCEMRGTPAPRNITQVEALGRATGSRSDYERLYQEWASIAATSQQASIRDVFKSVDEGTAAPYSLPPWVGRRDEGEPEVQSEGVIERMDSEGEVVPDYPSGPTAEEQAAKAVSELARIARDVTPEAAADSMTPGLAQTTARRQEFVVAWLRRYVAHLELRGRG